LVGVGGGLGPLLAPSMPCTAHGSMIQMNRQTNTNRFLGRMHMSLKICCFYHLSGWTGYISYIFLLGSLLIIRIKNYGTESSRNCLKFSLTFLGLFCCCCCLHYPSSTSIVIMLYFAAVISPLKSLLFLHSSEFYTVRLRAALWKKMNVSFVTSWVITIFTLLWLCSAFSIGDDCRGHAI
jgi:hypothetical protein